MKEFKGTPGPWVISKSSPKIIMSGSVFDDSEGYIIGSITGNDNSGFYADEAEACANAKLIAAAPDLLEALQKILSSAYEIEHDFYGLPGGEELNIAKVINDARAAIARALGGKQ